MNKTLDQVLSESLQPVYSQLGFAKTNLSGVALASVQSAEMLLDNAAAAVIEQSNLDVDQFNEALDEIALRDKEIADKESAIGLLRMSRDELTSRLLAAEATISESDVLVQESQARVDGIKAQLSVKCRELADAIREINYFKEMNPVRTKASLAEKKKELAEKQADNNTLRSEVNKLRKENASQKSKLSKMVDATTEMQEQCAYLEEKLNRMAHNNGVKEFTGPTGYHFYLTIFPWGLNTKAINPDVALLQDLDFHMEVRTNSGIGMLVSIDQFGAPVFPTIPGFEKAWPTGLTDHVQSEIMDQLSHTRPHIVELHEWASGVDISTLPLRQREIEALMSAGIHNLFDLIHRSPEELQERVNGFGEATARKVRAAGLGIMKDWQKSNKHQEKAA